LHVSSLSWSFYREADTAAAVFYPVRAGEIADVILSDADSDFLALYPVLLLVGEHDFSDEVRLDHNGQQHAAENSGLKRLCLRPTYQHWTHHPKTD
jgi:hypothetical protein